MARYVEKYIDIERQIEDLHYKYTKERRKITDEIQALENRQHVELLYLRYVKHNRLEEIACIMRKTNGAPYSYDHISWLHGQALKAFQEKYNL